MRLIWHQREDGLWNAACACNATIVGVQFKQRAMVEAAHFESAGQERSFRAATARFADNQIPACGPKLPEHNPNIPDPPVFP
jgi:hypothetical protein